MNFGFLGAGNMASAIVKGMCGSKFSPSENIYVYDISKTALDSLAKTCNVKTVLNTDELIGKCEFLFIAVKPQVCRELLPQLKGAINKYRPVVVSMAAGMAIETLEKMIGKDIPIIRMMPNINAVINESVTAVCKNDNVTPEAFKTVSQLLTCIGQAIPMEEKFFGIFTAMASNSPAFTYLFIDSLARGAQKLGMNKKLALDIAARAVYGSAKMLIETNEHPHELIDKVSSPGGSTIEGICVLSEEGFEASLVKAVEACVSKDKILNG